MDSDDDRLDDERVPRCRARWVRLRNSALPVGRGLAPSLLAMERRHVHRAAGDWHARRRAGGALHGLRGRRVPRRILGERQQALLRAVHRTGGRLVPCRGGRSADGRRAELRVERAGHRLCRGGAVPRPHWHRRQDLRATEERERVDSRRPPRRRERTAHDQPDGDRPLGGQRGHARCLRHLCQQPDWMDDAQARRAACLERRCAHHGRPHAGPDRRRRLAGRRRRDGLSGFEYEHIHLSVYARREPALERAGAARRPQLRDPFDTRARARDRRGHRRARLRGQRHGEGLALPPRGPNMAVSHANRGDRRPVRGPLQRARGPHPTRQLWCFTPRPRARTGALGRGGSRGR